MFGLIFFTMGEINEQLEIICTEGCSMIIETTAASFNLSIWNIVYHDTLARQSFIVTSLCIQIQRTNSGDMIKVEGCSR